MKDIEDMKNMVRNTAILVDVLSMDDLERVPVYELITHSDANAICFLALSVTVVGDEKLHAEAAPLLKKLEMLDSYYQAAPCVQCHAHTRLIIVPGKDGAEDQYAIAPQECQMLENNMFYQIVVEKRKFDAALAEVVQPYAGKPVTDELKANLACDCEKVVPQIEASMRRVIDEILMPAVS